MMKLQSFVVGLVIAFVASVAMAQTEPTVTPAGTETTMKPNKKAAKKHAHKVSAKKHKVGKHKKPSVS
jgi:multidrug efflux pump subunit AcrB